jgi:hypothetical protein
VRSLLTRLLRDHQVFDWFERHADCSRAAAAVLRAVLDDFGHAPRRVQEITALEHQGDEIVQWIFTHLHTTLLTPFDREDIHALATHLDDLLDSIEGAAQALVVYRVQAPTVDCLDLATVAQRAVEATHGAVMSLRSFDPAFELRAAEVHQLEHRADDLLHASLGGLFESAGRPVDILRWKDIYELLEAVTDRCEDVTNTIEGIFLKMR